MLDFKETTKYDSRTLKSNKNVKLDKVIISRNKLQLKEKKKKKL